jgi:hypothetical protein
MNTLERKVATATELLMAARDASVRNICVQVDLKELPTFRLSPGQALRGENANVALRFAAAQDGLQLSTDNRVDGVELNTDADRRALYNDTAVERLGRLVLRNLRIQGVVQLLARDQVRSGHVEADNIDIVAADARAYDQRPKGYGVEVIPGAFTLWNQHTERAVTITADLVGLTAGRAGAPVRGSGIFVGGGGENGGRLIDPPTRDRSGLQRRRDRSGHARPHHRRRICRLRRLRRQRP